MAKAKRKNEAVVKASENAGKKKPAKAKAKAEPVVVEAPPVPAKAKKKPAKAEKKPAPVVAEPPPVPAKTKKKTAKVKAEPVVVEAPPVPAKTKKKTAKAVPPEPAKKKGGRKQAPAPEPEKKPAKTKPEKKPAKTKAKPDEQPAARTPSKKKPASKKKPVSKKKPAGPTLAERLDRHRLYQLSVQSPEADLEFFVARYEELRGRKPKVLREDFCGTAYISATWAGSGKGRRAVGVDLDAATLQWGREHNLAPLPKEAQKRVDLRQANVLDGGGARSDMTCAMNFSYGVFKTRAEIKHYLEVVYQQLADDGMFVTELYGGTEAIVAVQDEREIEGDEETGGDFTYQWEQASYNPINHETLCHIHFKLSDGSRIEKAFTYDWRLWSIMELRELLHEVGFTTVRVYWEATDEDGDGTGEYYATEQEENQESWLVYLVAGK
jgi:hypothetical protein